MSKKDLSEMTADEIYQDWLKVKDTTWFIEMVDMIELESQFEDVTGEGIEAYHARQMLARQMRQGTTP